MKDESTKIRVNFHVTEGDGFLFNAIAAVHPSERSNTIRRLAQAGAMLERMVANGLPVMVSGGGQLPRTAESENQSSSPHIPLQSETTERKSGAKRKIGSEAESRKSPQKNQTTGEEKGFDDVPIGLNFG